MKKIVNYIQFINETYSFKNTTKDMGEKVTYTFTNRDNVKFIVSFEIENDGLGWSREYKIMSHNPYSELEKPDAINVLRTVTKITIDFIKMYDPDRIVIEHIPTNSERTASKKYDRSKENKRTKANRRFLLQELPKDYKYTNDGSTSIITKVG